MTWQPKETARKNGDRFIACFASTENLPRFVTEVSWFDPYVCGEFGWTIDNRCMVGRELEKWMPLPDPDAP